MFLLMDIDKNVVIFSDPKEIEKIMLVVREHGFDKVIPNGTWAEMSQTIKKFLDDGKQRRTQAEGAE